MSIGTTRPEEGNRYALPETAPMAVIAEGPVQRK
jgi:hypothetical protein